MAREGVEAETEAMRLLRAAREDDTPAARRLRARVQLQLVGVLIFAVCALVFVAWAWYVRTYVSSGDALATVSSYAISLMYVAILPLGIWSLQSGWAHASELVVFVLRYTAASGDERMPAVVDQPVQLGADELDHEHSFSPLRWLDRRRPLVGYLAAMLLLFVVVMSLIGGYPGWTWTGPLTFLRPILNPLPGIPWYAIFAASDIALLYYWFSGASGIVVTADAGGLRWSTGWPRKRTIRIAWDEVRSFTRLEFRHKWSPKPHTTYVLDCGRAILSWGYDPIWRSDEFPVETRLLARLIVTRIGLPLRQATPFAAEALYQAGGLPARWWARRLQMPRGAMMPPALPGLAAAFRLITPTSSRRRALVLVACLPFILYAGYAGAIIFLR